MDAGRVLIVEDDEAIATGLALNLKLAGRTTAIARDGDEALRLAGEEDFALILLDINLPKKNGLDDVCIDLAQRLVARDGVEVKLTHLEFELLVYFVRHPAQVFSRTHLFNVVWGQSAGSARTVDNFVGQLRKRFEGNPEAPRHFITVRGSGYRFDP